MLRNQNYLIYLIKQLNFKRSISQSYSPEEEPPTITYRFTDYTEDRIATSIEFEFSPHKKSLDIFVRNKGFKSMGDYDIDFSDDITITNIEDGSESYEVKNISDILRIFRKNDINSFVKHERQLKFKKIN